MPYAVAKRVASPVGKNDRLVVVFGGSLCVRRSCCSDFGAELLRLQEQYSQEIRDVASKEPNPIVQEVLFTIAAGHKSISDLSEQFSAAARQVTNELRRQKQDIIDPMKDALSDRTKMNAELTGKNASTQMWTLVVIWEKQSGH